MNFSFLRYLAVLPALCLLAQCASMQPVRPNSPDAQADANAEGPPASPEELLERFNLFANRA